MFKWKNGVYTENFTFPKENQSINPLPIIHGINTVIRVCLTDVKTGHFCMALTPTFSAQLDIPSTHDLSSMTMGRGQIGE